MNRTTAAHYWYQLPLLEGRRYSFQLSCGAESAHATTFAMEGRRGTATSGHGALMTNKGRSATGEAPAGDGRISARRGAASHARPSSPSELDTFAHLELACDEMFEREPAWQSDDEDCMCREDECDDDDAMSSSLPTPTIGFVSLADDGTPSSFLTAPLRDDGCMSAVDHGFAARILQASPPTIPVKRERETSPVLGGDGTVVAAVAAIDIDLQSTRPLSLDADVHMAHGMLASAIPVTTTQIFGTRGKHSKKQRDDSCHPGEDNSDALSSSAASCVSASTNVSSASTVSAESCFSFVPYMHPTIAFQVSPSEMWRCKDCLILHPADYKGCGKCGEKRENIEEGPFQLPGGSALSAAGDWFGNQLPPAYPQNMCPTFAFSASGCMVAGAERSPWNVARSSDSQNTSRRGQNVKGNPQMQKTARDGQKHWHDKMRLDYENAQTSMTLPQFMEQRYYCTARNLKCQKESLLIFLQLATQQKLITPMLFVHPADEANGFLGWTGFWILPGCGDKFRTGIEALFPETPKLNTLYHLFRRAGLVPDDWRRAWEGRVPFSWNPNRVS